MLTRVLFALVLMCGLATAACAEDAKVLALGITDHEVTQEEARKGRGAPRAALQYPCHRLCPGRATSRRATQWRWRCSTRTSRSSTTPRPLSEDQAKLLLQAGKRGVPAGGWPEGSYSAKVTITRDGKTLIEQSSKPVAFE